MSRSIACPSCVTLFIRGFNHWDQYRKYNSIKNWDNFNVSPSSFFAFNVAKSLHKSGIPFFLWNPVDTGHFFEIKVTQILPVCGSVTAIRVVAHWRSSFVPELRFSIYHGFSFRLCNLKNWFDEYFQTHGEWISIRFILQLV